MANAGAGAVHFTAANTTVSASIPKPAGGGHELTCDFIAGCDGFHRICRPALGDAVKFYDRSYPFGGLGILAEASPSSEALVDTHHESGFALFSMRSSKITRLYIQVPPDEEIGNWSDDAIWEEMLKRMTTCDGWEAELWSDPQQERNCHAQFRYGTDERRAAVSGW